MSRKKQIMPLELFEKILKDYSAMGGGKLSLTPEVGEVFLDKLLLERIQLVKRYPAITGLSLTTNAAVADMLDPADLRYIVSALDRVHVSVYGLDEEEYTAMTGTQLYGRFIHSLKLLVESIDDKSKIVFGFRLLKQYDDGKIRAWMEKTVGGCFQYHHTKEYSNWGGGLDTRIPLPYSGKWIEQNVNTGKCLMPLCAVMVYVDGRVSFCPCTDFDVSDELCIGDVNTASLSDIFNSIKNIRLWDTDMPSPVICSKCTFHKPIDDTDTLDLMFTNILDFIGG